MDYINPAGLNYQECRHRSRNSCRVRPLRTQDSRRYRHDITSRKETVQRHTQQTTPPANTTVKGIDVSKWQGEIDWNKVKADGIKFAMIRLGYGSADGNSCGLDGYFEKNVSNALKAGINIGCYFYSYATSVAAAKKENAHVALDQAEYQKRYDGLVARFDKAKARHTEVTDLIAEHMARKHQIEFYLNELRNREPLTEFRETDWLAMVDFITVHSKKDIRVTLKDGTEIKA